VDQARGSAALLGALHVHPAVVSQLQLHACVHQAIAKALQILELMQLLLI